jgi:hypothetical protein
MPIVRYQNLSDVITIPVGPTVFNPPTGTFRAYLYSPYVQMTGTGGINARTGPVSFIPAPPTEGAAVTIWDYYVYNPIVNNTVADVESAYIMKVDLDDGITIPTNFEQLISGSADRAEVQDSNYSSKAWSNLRYNGSRTSSPDFNVSY